MAKYNESKFHNVENIRKPAFLNILDLCNFTFLSGSGSVYENFLGTKTLGNYSGDGHDVTEPSDPKYFSTKLRSLQFDQTFTFLPTDVHDREYVIFTGHK